MNDASPPVGDEPHREGEASDDRDDATTDEGGRAPGVSDEASAPPREPSPSPAKKPAAEKPAPRKTDPKPHWFARVRSFVRSHWMVIDPRAAGLFRLVLGFLLLADTPRHWVEARMLYSNVGVLSNEYHLWRPSSGYQWSIFHAFSTVNEVHVLFALGMVSHFFLFVGYRARLFAVLSFIFMTSLDQRIPLVENGGYVVVNLACLWACFLPVGQRFGVDAWRKSWRMRRESKVETLNDRSDFTGEQKPVISLIYLIIIFNLTQLYFWNVVNKAGWIWREGYTLHYVLYLNRMLTMPGTWLRIIPGPMMRALDWSVLSVESMICVLIASPVAKRYTRPLAQLGMILIHTTFGITFRLGPFSWFLIGCSTLLWSPYQFADLKRWYLRRAPALVVGLAESSPVALALGRILSRIDGYDQIEFVERAQARLVEVRVANEPDAWVSEPAAALGLVARALPMGRYLYPVVRVLTLGTPARLVSYADAHRDEVARFFGLAPTGTELASDEGPATWDDTPLDTGVGPRWRLRTSFFFFVLAFIAFIAVIHLLPETFRLRKLVDAWDQDRELSSYTIGFVLVVSAVFSLLWPAKRATPVLLRARIAMRTFRLRELALGYYAICSLSQTWNENKGIPPQIKFQQPPAISTVINYPRLFQGWGMFAPNPIQEDGILVVDGYTIDGRHVDPYNGGVPDLDLTDAYALGISQLRQDYGNRIRLDGNAVYRDELKAYLLRWQEETGNPNDELAAFDVYWVRDRCPPLGEHKPVDNDPVAIATYRKPNYKPPPGAPPIPPSPQLRSAEQWQPKVPGFIPKIPSLHN